MGEIHFAYTLLAGLGSLFEKFWDGSHDRWNALWQSVSSGRSDAEIYIGGTFLLVNGVFWSYCALLSMVDLYQWPRFLLKYKIQEGKNAPVDSAKLAKAYRHVFWMMMTIYPALLWGGFYAAKARGGGAFADKLPSFQSAVAQLVVFAIVEEIGFFYTHYAAHCVPFLYKHIHKRHHEWQASVGVVALYAHPLEFIFSNLLPVGLGPLICDSHLLVTWVWFVLGIITTVNTHSGYHFPGMPSPEAHDFHHLTFNNCYGVLGVLDFLHGTDRKFYAAKESTRHFTFYSKTPIKQQSTGKPERPSSLLKILF